MKKLLLAILMASMLIFSLCGCTIRDPSDIGQGGIGVFDNIDLDADSSYTGALRIAYGSSDAETLAINAFVSSFNEKYPNIEVELVPIGGDYSSNVLNLARSAASLNRPEEMYDVFWLAQDYVSSFYQSDVLYPLGKIDEADTNFDTSDIVELALDVSSVNDTLYMMPRDYNQVVMYYNKDVFDAVDMPYPTDGMTRTEFVEMLEELQTRISTSTAKIGYGQYYRDMDFLVDSNVCWDSMIWPLLKSFGAEIVNENGEVVFDSENTSEALAFWKDLIQKGYACSIAQGKSASGTQFRMQNAALFFHVRATLTDILTADPDKEVLGVQNIGVVAIPDFSDGESEYYVGAGSSGYAMYSNTVHPTEAWLFLKHIVSVEGQQAFSETGNCVPVLKTLLNDENAAWRTWSEETIGSDFNNDAFIYKIEGGTTTRDFYQYIPVAAQSAVLNCIDEAMTNYVAQPSQTFALQMIKDAASKMTTAIAQAKG